MLTSSRSFGSRQSLWPAKFMLLSPATCTSKASFQVYNVSMSWMLPSALFFSHMRRVFSSEIVRAPCRERVWVAVGGGPVVANSDKHVECPMGEKVEPCGAAQTVGVPADRTLCVC